MMKPTRTLLLLGTTLRLTRLLVTDDIGQWWVKDPIDRAMDRYAARQGEQYETEVELDPSVEPPAEPWWWKYRSGLDCGWCAGFWIGAGVLAADRITDGTPLQPVWRAAQKALVLNLAMVTVGKKVGAFE